MESYYYREIDNTISKNYIDLVYCIEDMKNSLNLSQKEIIEKIDIADDIYNSVNIEGNQMTRNQITYFLEHDVTIRGVSFRDHIQVNNQKEILLTLKKYLFTDLKLDLDLILTLHNLVTKNELPNYESGVIRNDVVHIRTTDYIPPMPEDVPYFINELIEKYNTPDKNKTQFEKICELKCNFERIHPFFDGNGRTGRLLANILFLKNGYPYITVPVEERDLYFKAIENNELNLYFAEKIYNKQLELLNQSKDNNFDYDEYER